MSQEPTPASEVPVGGFNLEAPLPRQALLHVAQNIARARLKAQLTQQELAAAAELSRATVHLIEGGLGDPRLSTIARLAEALNLRLSDLLDAPR